MSKAKSDVVSIAPSETTTVVEDQSRSNQVRTTLTGKPIQYKHDPFTNMEVGFGTGNAGANLLSPGYTDSSAVRIPIKLSDVPGWFGNESSKEPSRSDPKKGGFLSRLKGSNGDKRKVEDIKVVTMRRDDYLKYWVKGEDGRFAPEVQEPPEGRAEWLKKQLDMLAELESQ